jgi:hypothetical protein
LQHLAVTSTTQAKAIIFNADQNADTLELNDERFDELVAGLNGQVQRS